MWPDCDHVKMLYWKKKNKQQAKQKKNKIGTSAGFPHAFLWTKKMHLLQLLEIKRTYHFENDVHTQAQAQASGESRGGAQWAQPLF